MENILGSHLEICSPHSSQNDSFKTIEWLSVLLKINSKLPTTAHKTLPGWASDSYPAVSPQGHPSPLPFPFRTS